MKIGLAQFEVNDGATLLLQFPGMGKDGERSFSAHHCHPGSQGSHSVLLFEKSLGHGCSRYAQGIHETRKEIESSGSRGQFNNLLIIIEALQLGVEPIVDLVR